MFGGLQGVHGRCGHLAVPIGVTLVPVGDWEVRVKERYSSDVSIDSNSSLMTREATGRV